MSAGVRGFFSDLEDRLGVTYRPVTKWVAYACLVAFVAVVFVPGRLLFDLLGASPANTLYRYQLWQLVTYALMHGGFGHLFFNLFTFWMFGRRLEYQWGSSTYLRFCLLAAMAAVGVHLGAMVLLGTPQATIVGLSGVCYAVLFAYAYYFRDEVVYLYFLLPVKVKYFAIGLGVLTLFASFQSSGSNVAHLTHLGGLVFGILFVRFPWLFDWFRLPSIGGGRGRRSRGPSRFHDL